MNKLIYHACEGRAVDIKTLENSSYIDLLVHVDCYMDKVQTHNDQIEKMELEAKAKKRNGRSGSRHI